LDIGGGGGGIIGRAYGSRVVAIDRLKEELEEAPDGPLKIVMDARELQFLDGGLPTATAFFTFMYIKGEDHHRIFEEVFRVLASDGRLYLWDAVLPVRVEGTPEIAIVPVTAQLPGGEAVSNFYGVRWPSEGRDLAYYQRLAEEAGFEVVVGGTRDQHVFLELRKP
jgi:ubiquinone/menaquinone biosynthesis C-methylase UbiE